MIPIARPLPPTSAPRRAWLIELLVAGAAAAFLPIVFAAPLELGDDEAAAVDALPRRLLSVVPAALTRLHPTVDGPAVYQPITALSLWIDDAMARYASNGAPHPALRARYWRRTNLVLHVLNGLLVVALYRRLGAGRLATLVAGWLFMLHPAQVEPIAWAAQRGPLLAATGALLAFEAHFRWRAAGHAVWRVASLAMFGFALLAHPAGWPLALLFVFIEGPASGDAPAARVRRAAPLLALALAAAVAWLIALRRGGVLAAAVRDPTAIGAALLTMLRRLAWPNAPAPLPDWPAAGAATLAAFALGCAGLSLLAWRDARLRPLWVALGGALVLLLPPAVAACGAAGPPAESAACFVLVLAGLPLIAVLNRVEVAGRESLRMSLWMAPLVLAIAVGSRTRERAAQWTDTPTLLEAVVERTPSAVRARAALAEWHARRNEHVRAVELAAEAIAVDPASPSANLALGIARLALGDAPAALPPLERAYAARPDWPRTAWKLGAALVRVGRAADALPPLERARDLEPEHAGIRFELGEAFLALGRPAQARAELQRALNLGRNEPETHLGLAIAWAEIDVPDLARRHLAAAVAGDAAMARRAASQPALQRLATRPDFARLLDPTPTVAPAHER